MKSAVLVGFVTLAAAFAAGACSSDSGINVVANPMKGGAGGTGSGAAGGNTGINTDGGPGGESGCGSFCLPDAKFEPKLDGPVLSAEVNCGLSEFQLQRLNPEILVLLDRSSSTTDNFLNPNIWEQQRAAIKAVAQATNATVDMGVYFFPFGGNGQAACRVRPGGPEVPIASMNGSTISTAVDNPQNQPIPLSVGYSLGTNTDGIVTAGRMYLQARNTPNPKFLLLATDGQPTCIGTTQLANSSDPAMIAAAADAADNAVRAAVTAGFPVFVIGVAASPTREPTAPATLDRLAISGTRPRPMNGTQPRFYPANSQAELVSAFNSIVAVAATCEFDLKAQPPVPENVAVDLTVNNVKKRLMKGTSWMYSSDMKKIIITGADCDAIKAPNATVDVNIIFGCKDIPIE